MWVTLVGDVRVPAPEDRRRWWWSRRHWLLPTLLGFAVGWVLLWVSSPHSVDGGLYGAVTGNAARGDWWSLRFAGERYFNKPPLAFWFAAAPTRVIGPAEWGQRLTSVVPMVLGVIATAGLARELAGRMAAMLAGLVLVGTFDYSRWSVRFVMDYWACALMVCWAWSVVRSAREDRGSAAGLLLGGAALGLSLLAKPLFALVGVPIMGLWLLVVGRRDRLGALMGSAIVAVGVALPWHASMTELHGGAFTGTYFGEQSIERAGGGRFDADPWWWYIGHFAQTYWPWAIAVAGAAVVWARRGRLTTDRRAELLALIWCVVWLALASFVFADKRERYIMHLYPVVSVPIGVWLARFSPRWLRRSGHGTLQRNVLVVAGVAVVLAPIVSLALGPESGEVHRLGRSLRDVPGEVWIAPGVLDRNEVGIVSAMAERDVRVGWPGADGGLVVGERDQPGLSGLDAAVVFGLERYAVYRVPLSGR